MKMTLWRCDFKVIHIEDVCDIRATFLVMADVWDSRFPNVGPIE